MEKKNAGNLRRILYFILCLVIYTFSNGQHSIPAFVWIYPILFLLAVRLHSSFKTCFLLLAIYITGFVIQFLHVIGMGIWICLLAAVLTSGLRVLPYIIYLKSKKNYVSTVFFAAAAVTADYVVYLIYPILGGLSDAYTQYQNLFLIQLVTLFGTYGITFTIHWTAAVIVWLWDNRKEWRKVKKPLYIYSTVLGCIFIYNAFLLYVPTEQRESVRIAGVTAPVSHLLEEDPDVSAVFYSNSFTGRNLSETKRKLSEIQDELFIKTNREADAGAKIVFWSELNGAVLKEDEPSLLDKASDIARSRKIYLILSLLVKTPYEDLKENKTVAFDTNGQILSEYYKYGRSVGELCLKGDGKQKDFHTDYGRIAPFICSDMAFISAIRQAGKNNIDILIVPASDWKAMSPVAIRTAVIRGIENGCCVVRHTNQGISVAADYRGKILSWTDYFASATKSMTAQVPVKGRFTIYPYIGDLFAYICGLYLLFSFLYFIRKTRK